MFSKDHILSEILRTAKENGGAPLGVDRFYAETGIKEGDWRGKHWARWGDAIKEAGLEPNSLQGAYEESYLLERLASLTRELGRFPTVAELKLKARSDSTFPSEKTFRSRWATREQATKLAQFCEGEARYGDITRIVATYLTKTEPKTEMAPAVEETYGQVYLLKSGRYYKIGRSNAIGRRERELQIQLPERAFVVHSIKTDDPTGIEEYWHKRFDHLRKNGEWFDLSAADIAAFRRRKFM